MEEDEEIIKKLMNMLGSGRELKFKSPNGQTIRVSFEGNSYNQTEAGSERDRSQDTQEHPERGQIAPHQEQMEARAEEEDSCRSDNPFLEQEQQQEQNPISLQEEEKPFWIKEDLQEMEEDFHALGRLEPEEEPFHLPHIQHILEVDSESSKREDSLFRELVMHDDHEFVEKPAKKERSKRIHLSTKQTKKDNESVISFFKEEHGNGVELPGDRELTAPLSLASSPVISRLKEDLDLVQHKSQSVKESINRLKERHPESQQFVEIISSRLDQLQSMEKSLSLLNSSISNSLGQSFDVSLLSFHRALSDPLCHLMAQFVHKARDDAAKRVADCLPSSFLFMYSQPLVDTKRREVAEQLDYFEEEQAVQKILRQGKCRVDYIHVPATLQQFHDWINKGVEILHFCGHGVQGQEENYLLFETEAGETQSVTGCRLAEILTGHRAPKLVLVASCHSESAGRVFLDAGAGHVICVRDQYKILDEACHQFVRLFYITCINGGSTICQAFQRAKQQLLLKGKFSKHECQKFLLLRAHPGNICPQRFQPRNEVLGFNDLNPRPELNKYMLSRVQHYIPRSREIFDILQLVQAKKRRYVTIVGQAGLGKSTLARQLVRYIQFRASFRDGVVYLELARCETMAKVYEVLDLQFSQAAVPGRTQGERAVRLARELGEKQVLLVFDNCQAIMASQDREQFKRLTEVLMKHCLNAVFIFTNRYSIGKQIDYCSEALYQLGRLTDTQSRALFFKKVPREITRKEYEDFFKLDEDNPSDISHHSFFEFLNGHPEAICLTASLLAERSLSDLHRLLLQPDITSELHRGAQREGTYREGVNRVVATAMRISLNVVQHKYREASQMVKVLSLLPNGLQAEMMQKIFTHGGKEGGRWKQIVKRLVGHSLVQCIEKAGCRYYLVHPQVITEVQHQMGLQEKIRYHERISGELLQRINKIYKFVGTSSQYSQRAQELFLVQEDNYRAIFMRELDFIGQKYPLRKFYENLFKFQFQGLDEQQKNDFGEKRIADADILAQVQARKKRSLQSQQNTQKRDAIDLIMVYYITILFVIKKNPATINSYLTYAFTISLKRSKHLVLANLLRLKGCIYLAGGADNDAKQFFQVAHSEFAQLGCGLGSACCEAALGYIKLSESQYAPAKKNLQNALKYYEEIPHPFGKHYLNRWLCSLKSKMNKEERELINHKLEAQKLLKETKENLRSNNLNNTSYVKHKFGYFAFRFLFDNISLFLQATFEVDLRPKFINPNLKKHALQKNNVILEDIYNEENPNDDVTEISKPQPKIESKWDKAESKLDLANTRPLKTAKNKIQVKEETTKTTKEEIVKDSKEQAQVKSIFPFSNKVSNKKATYTANAKTVTTPKAPKQP